MCDADGDPCSVWNEHRRKARKTHQCIGCRETIEAGHSYIETRSLFDGHWSTHKHCLRCSALFDAIIAANWQAGEINVAVDPYFACGEKWVDNFGPPPPEVEALAFALPGEVWV